MAFDQKIHGPYRKPSGKWQSKTQMFEPKLRSKYGICSSFYYGFGQPE